jgi:hypothetical protein
VNRRSTWTIVVAAVALVAAAAAIELAMGRVVMCRCGYVKLWQGVVNSPENSQHVTDWYTFSHVIHGIGFYALLWLLARRVPVGVRLLAAVFIEAVWEVFENTPFVIDRYRTATIALDYYGDSLVNSVSDIAAMMIGFWIARRLPVLASVALVIALEVFAVVMIRDNLTLNIVMLLYPIEAIRQWQSAAQ